MDEQKSKPKRPKGRPKVDPNRKQYSFYCTTDEILYLRSLLKKIRIMLNAEVENRDKQEKSYDK